jgi:rare lipoprotein A
MPSLVRVTNLDNGRSIVVRVNDRGPFAKGRILDMSRRAAQLLGYEQTGTAKVRVQILATESRQLAAQMKAQGAVQVAGNARPYRVDVQPGETAPLNAPRAAVSSTPLAPPPGVPAAAQPTGSPAVVATPLTPSTSSPSVAATPLGAPPGPLVPPASSPGVLVPRSVAARTPGLVQVAKQEVTQTVPKKGAQIYIQAGAFTNAQNAQRLSGQLRTVGPTKVVPVTVSNHQFYRVRIGPLASVEAGDRALDQVVAAGHPEARIVVD